MESFSFPAAPCPTRKPFLEPSVPDASLLMNAPPANTYQAWRNNYNTVDQSKKVTTSILKKQVRFDGPAVIPIQKVETNYRNESCRNSLGNQSTETSVPQFQTPPLNKVLKNKPFQEIYMANIPNRHLDLSLVDLNKPSNNANSNNTPYPCTEIDNNNVENVIQFSTPPPKPPTTYKEFLEMQKHLKDSEKTNDKQAANYCITDIFNYTSPTLDSGKRQARLSKKDGSYRGQGFNVENYCDKLKRNEKISSPKFNKNDTEKENDYKEYDVPKIPIRQPLLPSTSAPNHYDSFDLQQDLQRYRIKSQQNSQKCDSSVQTSIMNVSKQEDPKEACSTEIAKNTDEPTVKDLLKIIQQQNEQLLVLQKQVANLLDFKDAQKRIEANNQRIHEENNFVPPVRDQRDYLNSAGSTPRKGPLPKFSIDLMTSFEVSFRPQQNMYQRKPRDFVTQEPKIQEIIENDTNVLDTRDNVKRITDPSLYLQEPISVPESCPSPEPSIRIDMKDYESSDEDEEDTTSDIGASFYKNMMDQVNKIIQSAQKQTTYDGRISKNDDIKDRTLSKVRDATIKQLKKIGMNFSPIEEVSDANCSNIEEDETTEQINTAVKQLLMKYLPDDQLSKFTRENNGAHSQKRSTDKIVLNSRGPQFSFATVQFMKKYDLIASDASEVPKRFNIQKKAKPSRMYKGVQNNPKILDISTLKQQPKLL